MRTARPQPGGFAAKAKDLQALRDAVDQAATVSGALWLSYLGIFFYLAIAAGAVTHKDLFFENPVKLPFLNVELPLTAFFALGPLLFLIVHAYTLLHFAMLAGKVGEFHKELEAKIRPDETRARLRRQLPSNIFVQFLAGPPDIRSGALGVMLKLIAWISLILGPIVLLMLFQLQFLPYQDQVVSWWQRIAVVVDLLLLWTMWPFIGRGTKDWLHRGDFRRPKIRILLLLSLVPVTVAFIVATFPGEWLHKQIPAVHFQWTPHKLLVAGEVDPHSQRPSTIWSNRLVVPGIDLREQPKFDTKEKIESRPTTLWLRKRQLEGAILDGAYLPKADFTGARLQGASLVQAQLQGAKLDGAKLQGASLALAQLQGTSLISAQLQGASLTLAQLQGTRLLGAQLQGASLDDAELQGASLVQAQLQGASLERARLHGAWFEQTQLQGASLEGARLQGASFVWAQLQGAKLDHAKLEGASLDDVFVWRADPSKALLERAYVNNTDGTPKHRNADGTPKYRGLDCKPGETCPLSAAFYAALRGLIEETVPPSRLQREALDRIIRLDPDQPIDDSSDSWVDLQKKRSTLYQLYQYRKYLVGALQRIGCDARGAPYIVRSLTSRIVYRFPNDTIRAGELASAFLDETICYGARGLSETEKAELREIRDRARPIPAAPAPEAKAAQ